MITSKFKATIFVLIVLLISGLALWQWRVRGAKLTKEVQKTAKVTQGKITISFTIDGKTVVDSRNLSFELGGIVRGVKVKEGDEVKPWQTLAYLDPSEAQKNLEKALRDYSKERNDFDETTQVEYADTLLTDTIKRILEKNQWDLDKAVLDVELKNIAYRKSFLTSPIKGIVAAVNIKPGETVSSQGSIPAIVVVDPNSIHFESYVEDIEALKIKPGSNVRLKLDAIPNEEFTGKVEFVSPVATIDENDLSTYKVVINFDQLNSQLLDGLSGEAEIITKEVAKTLKIPNTTVKRENGQSIVFVVNQNGKTTKREVKLGFTNGKEVQVISGLQLGETLIVF